MYLIAGCGEVVDAVVGHRRLNRGVGVFESGLKPFTALDGEEVPAEFDDLGP